MIINKNSNHSQLLKTVYIMNDGSTDLKKFNNIKHFSLST